MRTRTAKPSTKITTRTAKPEDFKVGTILIHPEYQFQIAKHYYAGIWEADGTAGQGRIVVFESDARHWQVKEENTI